MPGNTKEILYRIAELRIRERKNADAVAAQINREFPGEHLSREMVVARLSDALESELIRLQPATNNVLAADLEGRFHCEPGSIRVAECPHKESNAGISYCAAEWAVELIAEISRGTGNEETWLGLGPGSATRDFAQRLAQLLKEKATPPKLNLVAISAGCPPDHPQYSSISFFNLFPAGVVNKQLGFFAETFMKTKDFERMKRESRYGTREAFEIKNDVRLVVTSMGNKCPHSLFRVFHEQSSGAVGQAGTGTKWWNSCIGDCQYRPFGMDGPIQEGPDDLRAVTLFELEELRELAKQRYRHVLLIARPCWHCPPGNTRADALYPLLANQKLRIWSRLALDAATARELIQTHEKMSKRSGK